ncbi:MAG: polymer-forming cytoskeletal protein [Gammaproteobacteria bacterium]|nr:polymer-forming cytoskeletal protein [Gammaproteobacteria bacterium]
MIATLKRRFLDGIGEAPTLITEGSRLTGDLQTSGSLILCGTIRGDGQVGRALQMTVNAQWHGEVHARSAVISGQLTGKLVIEEKVEFGASAVIRADVVARRIAVARGAVIDGTVTVTSGEPVRHFDEKRKAR